MKILSSVLNCIFSFTVFYSLIFNYKTTVLAWDNTSAQTQLQQSILPVRFIYVDENDVIKKAFNNLTDHNSAYILKFYRIETNTEIPITDTLLNNFKQLINKVDISQQGFINIGQDGQNLNQITNPNIVIFNSPQGLQEIHTFI